MSAEGSVTRWVTALKDGDVAAAQPLWERYHRRLVGLAREKLRTARRRAADEEDVVQSAFHSFFRGVAGGRFPRLDDRDNLWKLLVVITARKAVDQLAREHARRRGRWHTPGRIADVPRAGRVGRGRHRAGRRRRADPGIRRPGRGGVRAAARPARRRHAPPGRRLEDGGTDRRR